MNNGKTTSFSILAGVIIPGAVMFGARYFGQGTSNVHADQELAPISQMAVVPQVTLLPVIAEATKKEIQSPFWVEVEDFNNQLDPFAGMNNPQPAKQAIVSDFIVSAILPNAKNPLAVINSKPSRIGDDVGNGWKLEQIDGHKRTVILLHKTGKKITLVMAVKD